MELLTDSCCSPTPPGASRVPPVSAEGSGIALELPPKPALPPALFSHPPIQCQQVPWALPSNLSRMLTPSQSAPWSAPIISHVDQFSTLPPPWLPGSRPCSPQAISPSSHQRACVSTYVRAVPALPPGLSFLRVKAKVLPGAHKADAFICPSLPSPPPSRPLAHSASATRASLFLHHAKLHPAPGPLHRMFPTPESLFFQIPTRLPLYFWSLLKCCLLRVSPPPSPWTPPQVPPPPPHGVRLSKRPLDSLLLQIWSSNPQPQPHPRAIRMQSPVPHPRPTQPEPAF